MGPEVIVFLEDGSELFDADAAKHICTKRANGDVAFAFEDWATERWFWSACQKWQVRYYPPSLD